jgi:hypothetical protein
VARDRRPARRAPLDPASEFRAFEAAGAWRAGRRDRGSARERLPVLAVPGRAHARYSRQIPHEDSSRASLESGGARVSARSRSYGDRTRIPYSARQSGAAERVGIEDARPSRPDPTSCVLAASSSTSGRDHDERPTETFLDARYPEWGRIPGRGASPHICVGTVHDLKRELSAPESMLLIGISLSSKCTGAHNALVPATRCRPWLQGKGAGSVRLSEDPPYDSTRTADCSGDCPV